MMIPPISSPFIPSRHGLKGPLTLALLLLASSAQAQSVADNASSVSSFPAVTVTATMSEHDARTAPASVTIITAEELAERNASDVLDAVRGAPGITLQGTGLGGRKTIALRGMEGKHVLMLVDGRRVSASDDIIGHSDYQYGWLPVSVIERIEVIRGPMSALYGSEALGGVINIITKRSNDHWTGSLSTKGYLGRDNEAASEGTISLFATGPLTEQLRLSVNADYAHREPVAQREDTRYSEIEGHKPRTVGLNAEWQILPGQRLELGMVDGEELRFYDTVYTPFVMPPNPPKPSVPYQNRYQLDRRQTHIGWKGQAAQEGGWQAHLSAYRSELSAHNKPSNGIAPNRPNELQDDVVEGHLSLGLGTHQFAVGGEWRKEELVNSGFPTGRGDLTHKALFIQDEFGLGGGLLATLGLRGDHHSMFGSEISPRAYLVWDASEALVVKGGFGHAFKAPTLKQISPEYDGAGHGGPMSFLGNADVKPETSNSFELGADWQASPAWSLRATAFHTEVKQLINLTYIGKVGPRSIYRYENTAAARIQGLETGFTWSIIPALQWNVDTTWLDARDKTTDKRLSSRPNTRTTSRLIWRAGSWDSQLGAEYTSSQYTGVDNKGADRKVPAYILWNASVGTAWNWGSQQRLSLRVGVENLGNLRLAEKSANFNYAEQGRRAFVSARFDF